MTRRPNLLTRESLPASPRQQRSLDNRERLKAAALALFGQRGYERTSIEEIARKANLAVGGFYLHFRSKRQLLIVLMDELLQGLERLQFTVDGGGDTHAVLYAALARAFATDLQYLGAYRAWQEAVLSDPELARAQRRIHRWTTARVRAVFERLQQHPRARRDVDTGSLARVIDAFFWTLLAQARQLSRADLDKAVHAAAHLIYHALVQDPV